MKKCWKFAKAKAAKTGELYLYGPIASETWYGDEVTPKQFKDDLDALGEIETLNIYLNSVGGDVWAGWAIHSMLARVQAQKNLYIDGIAASIATVIAMAADKIFMAKNALFMIHNAWTYTVGNAEDHRKAVELLVRVDDVARELYAKKTGKDADEVRAMMDAETWMSADEALAAGFADELVAEKKAAACIRGGTIVYPDGTEQDAGRYAAALAGRLPEAQQKPNPPEMPAGIAAIYEKAHEINLRRMERYEH